MPCTLPHDARAVSWLTVAPRTSPYPGPAAIEPLVRSIVSWGRYANLIEYDSAGKVLRLKE